jgi:hypothetical protein
MDWTQALTVFAVIATNLGTVIGLFIHSDNKAEANRKETADVLKGIREDMKDFHEAMKDFHGRLCAIEERRNKILEK